MRFPIKDTLTPDEVESGLRAVIRDGLASQAMATLTGGVFLVAFALELGASNAVIGLMAAIAPLAQLLQIPSVFLVNRLQNRRAISVVGSAIGRTFWLFIAAVPLIATGSAGVTLLLAFMLCAAAFGAVSTCGWNSWMRDLIPQDRLGSFFSKRMTMATALAIVLSLGAAFFIDSWTQQFPQRALLGYSMLFMVGAAAGLLGAYFISTIPEPRMKVTPTHFRELLGAPFRNTNFRNLLVFLGSWNFAVNLAAPFFTVYMLQRLGLNLSLVIALTVLSQLVHAGFLRVWGGLSDRYSNTAVLGVCGPLFIFAIFGWTFTTMPDAHALTMPFLIGLHALMGLAMAGVTLATGNISLKLAPQGEATAYLATSTLVNSLAAALAPILGGLLADLFAGRSVEWTLTFTGPERAITVQTLNLQQWDFFFTLAFLVGLYSLHRLALVHEEGHVDRRELVTTFRSLTRRRLDNFSTVGGLRQLITFPFGLLAGEQPEEEEPAAASQQ